MRINQNKWLLLLLPVMLAGSCREEEKQPAGNNTKIDSLVRIPRTNNYAEPDKSPLDISYYPTEYTKMKMLRQDTVPLIARVIYSRPQTKGRKIFGPDSSYIVPNGKIWRLGANEATEIEFFVPVNCQQQKIEKGRYILYCIPQADRWELVLNSNIYSFGLHIDTTRDVTRFTVPVTTLNSNTDYLSIVFQKNNKGADLVVAWDNREARLPFYF